MVEIIVIFERPTRQKAKDLIICFLPSRGECQTAQLDECLRVSGFSRNTAARAKADLVKQGKIRHYNTGFGPSKTWYTSLL